MGSWGYRAGQVFALSPPAHFQVESPCRDRSRGNLTATSSNHGKGPGRHSATLQSCSVLPCPALPGAPLNGNEGSGPRSIHSLLPTPTANFDFSSSITRPSRSACTPPSHHLGIRRPPGNFLEPVPSLHTSFRFAWPHVTPPFRCPRGTVGGDACLTFAQQQQRSGSLTLYLQAVVWTG